MATSKKDDKYLILNSKSWIKGVEDAIDYADKNNLNYELVWGLKHKDLLNKEAVFYREKDKMNLTWMCCTCKTYWS